MTSMYSNRSGEDERDACLQCQLLTSDIKYVSGKTIQNLVERFRCNIWYLAGFILPLNFQTYTTQ